MVVSKVDLDFLMGDHDLFTYLSFTEENVCNLCTRHNIRKIFDGNQYGMQ